MLFLRRVHPRISTYASNSPTKLLQWFDPSKRRYGRLLPPMMWLGVEYLRSALSVPLGTLDRACCCLTAMRVWYTRELRNLGGRYKARVVRAVVAAKG